MLAVRCKRFGFHQALRAGKHGVITRQIPGQVGKRALHLPHQLHDRHQVAVAHRSGQNTVSAKADAQQIRAVHRPGKSDVAQVGKVAALHPRGLVLFHQAGRLRRSLLLLCKGAHDEQAFQPLLQKDPQGAVRFLNIFVQAFQNFPKSIRQRKHGCTAGHQHPEKTRLQP